MGRANNGQLGGLLNPLVDTRVPILRAFIVLRKEHFGGFMFNPHLPPEERLDHIRFRIATLCNGDHTLREIKDIIGNDLLHSKEYVDLLVNRAISSFDQRFAVRWREEKLEIPRSFGNLEYDGLHVRDHGQLSMPLFAIWEITGACNLRCRHCLSNAGKPFPDELNTQEAKKLIDDLAETKIFSVHFSGGEPLVRPDVFELLEHASQRNLGVELLTNGVLVTKETVDRLEDTVVSNVQVSVDGIGETHDDFRGMNGCYERAIHAVKLLRNAGYGVTISSAVTKQNIAQVPEIIDMAADLGASSYKATMFMPAGRGKSNVDDLILTPEDVKGFTFMIAEKKEEVGDKINIACETDFPWLAEGTNEQTPSSPETDRVGCSAGNSTLYINPDGKIAPCPFLRDFIAGDARKEDLKEIWNNSSMFDTFRSITKGDLKGKCGDCEYLGSSCLGGCRAAAYAHTGDLYAEDPLCWKDLV